MGEDENLHEFMLSYNKLARRKKHPIVDIIMPTNLNNSNLQQNQVPHVNLQQINVRYLIL